MIGFSMPRSVTTYEEVKECRIPEPNIYKPNEWLANSMNEDYVREKERILYSIASMDRSNELPPEPKDPAIYIYDIEDPQQKRLSAYFEALQ